MRVFLRIFDTVTEVTAVRLRHRGTAEVTFQPPSSIHQRAPFSLTSLAGLLLTMCRHYCLRQAAFPNSATRRSPTIRPYVHYNMPHLKIQLYVCICMYFIWRNPLRLHIIIKRIKTGISGFKPRITQESITILISTVVL